jgi:AcrR family transcriptional regulator
VPRDAERTKRLLREAAVVEFAAHGLHGTTVERIAARAGVNKERLYSYFGDKAALFAAVVSEQFIRIATDVPLAVGSPAEVAEFVAQAFDYQLDHPELGRLLAWEGFSDRGVLPDEAIRTRQYRDKVASLGESQRSGAISSAIPPEHLLFLLLALASSWVAAPQLARLITGVPGGEIDRSVRRAAVAEAARRLAQP